MGLQYLEALKVLGAAPSTKIVLPMELTSMLQGVAALTDRAFADTSAAAEGDTAPAAAAPK